MILPALTEATSPFFRPIKYSLFPPLGLATLAAYVRDDDDVTICDEHVENLRLNDEPDLVVIQVYITSARRSYEIADHYRRRDHLASPRHFLSGATEQEGSGGPARASRGRKDQTGHRPNLPAKRNP
jgi:hypothetical protein